AKDRVVGCDPPNVPGGRVGADAAEELTDLPFPAAEIGAQDRFPFIVGNLHADEAFASPTEEEFALTGDAEVPHPLRVTSGRNEVPASAEGREVDRRWARLPRLAAANFENTRAPDADPDAS